MEVRFSALIQTGPGAHPVSYTVRIESFSRVKRLECGVDHPPPSSAEAAESIEQYLYSPSESSWLFFGELNALNTVFTRTRHAFR